MAWNIDSSIYKIKAGLSEADILRSLGENPIQIRVETQQAIGGDSGNDLLLGGPEDNLLIGDIGHDTIYGEAGNNTLFGGTSHLIVEDWEGQDFLVGGLGDDLIFGNQADDDLYGGEGDDTLYGGKDNDRLYGNGGNDVLFGDLGSDSLWGDEGENRFEIGRRFDVPGVLTTGGPTLDNADWIMDFTPGQDLLGLLGGLTFDELNIFAGTGENAGDTIIQDKITQEYLAIVKNITPEAIARDNFWPSSQPTLPSSPPPNPPIIPSVPVEETSPANVVSPVQEIDLTHPIVGTVPEQQKPDLIIFPDDNLSETEEDKPSDLQPDVPAQTPEDEPSDLQPDVPAQTPEDEPSDLQTDVPAQTPEDEPSDLQTDVPPETPEDEPSNLQTDVPAETPEDDNTDLEPDVSAETPEDDNTDLEPDVPAETPEDDNTDLEPDVPAETPEDDNTDLEPDVPAQTPEEENPDEPIPDDEPILDEDETPPNDEEEGDNSSGEIEDDPIDENGEDDSSGDDSETSVTVSYVDATSGIIADLSEGRVTRLFTTSEEVPFKILPLGDSNTRGFPNQASIGGYRTRLWERLVEENGFNIDFVGQANSGPQSIDKNHEGRGGFTITQLLDNSEKFSGYNQPTDPLYTTIQEALNYAQPDAVLLMAGTNDILQNKPVETALTDLGILVDKIVETMPTAQVLVSSIIPHTSTNATRQQRTTEFSQQVEEIVVAPRANTNPNIRFVDMFNLPFVPGDYDNDGIHLKASGYDKLADKWYSEIRMLPSGEETLTDVQNIIGSAYDDTLIGDDQANMIRGGEGNDWLLGDGGEDTFILASGEGTNTIADFENGIDRIGLSEGLQFEQLVISPGSDANQTQIAIADTGESLATLLGIDASMINADDFILV